MIPPLDMGIISRNLGHILLLSSLLYQLRCAAGLRLRDHEAGDEADGEVDAGERQHEAGHAGQQGGLGEVAALLVDRQVVRVQDGSLDLREESTRTTFWIQYSDNTKNRKILGHRLRKLAPTLAGGGITQPRAKRFADAPPPPPPYNKPG